MLDLGIEFTGRHPMLAVSEKKHRLSLDVYKGTVAVAYTACTRNRATFFMNALRVEQAAKVLTDEADRWKCEVVVYLFMPDHVHILLKGRREDSDTYRAMKAFKQKTGYLFSLAGHGIVWQKDFCDHILRTVSDFSNQLRYILDNPIRAGLTRRWPEYPHKGSTIFDLDHWDAG
jgi:putative transposase